MSNLKRLKLKKLTYKHQKKKSLNLQEKKYLKSII